MAITLNIPYLIAVSAHPSELLCPLALHGIVVYSIGIVLRLTDLHVDSTTKPFLSKLPKHQSDYHFRSFRYTKK